MRPIALRSSVLGVATTLLLAACGDAGTPQTPTAPAAPAAPSPGETPIVPAGDTSAAPTKADTTPSAPSAPPTPAAPGTSAPTAQEPAAPAAKPVAPPPAAPKPPEPQPVPPEVQAEVAKSLALLAAGDANGARAATAAAEQRLGESAALRLVAARAHLRLAEQEFGGNGDAFLTQGHVADAHLAWKQATALDPAVVGAAALRARILRFEEKPRLAKELLTAELAIRPDDRECLRVLAEMATAGREWEQADNLWTKLANLEPTDGVAQLEAGVAKQWLRTPGDTVARRYAEACRLMPEDERALKLLAGIHGGDVAKKLAAFQAVIDANPKCILPRIWMAWILRKEGTPDVAKAKAILKEAVALAPQHFGARTNYADLLRESGAPAVEFLPEYAAAAECAAPGAVDDIARLANTILHENRDPKAVPLSIRTRLCDAIGAKLPGEGWFANNAGFWFRDFGRDYELSAKYYEMAVAAQPDDQDFLNDCALIYLFHLTDRKERCRPMFEKVIRLVDEEGQEPVRGYWDALENMCKYWFERGEWAKCVETAKKRLVPEAKLDGRPYPSLVAAGWKVKAEGKLKTQK